MCEEGLRRKVTRKDAWTGDASTVYEVYAEFNDGEEHVLWVKRTGGIDDHPWTVEAEEFQDYVDPALFPKVGERWGWSPAGIHYVVVAVDAAKRTWNFVEVERFPSLYSGQSEANDSGRFYTRPLPETGMKNYSDKYES